ncbi:MAG: DedA family protein, partial [Pseudanabaena sp. ELA607]
MSLELFSLETIQEWAHQYGYGLVFFGIMLENAGIPLPGETITLVGGFLAGSGELNYSLVLASAVGGAILGDSMGYWLGRWGGMGALEKIGKLFRLPLAELEEARERFRGNADRAVFFGRFIAVLRIFAGPMAGISGMPYGRFLVFNALGALLWGTIMVTLAYFAGRFVPLATLVTVVLRFGVIAFGVVALWFGAVWLRQKLMSRKSKINEVSISTNTSVRSSDSSKEQNNLDQKEVVDIAGK